MTRVRSVFQYAFDKGRRERAPATAVGSGSRPRPYYDGSGRKTARGYRRPTCPPARRCRRRVGVQREGPASHTLRHVFRTVADASRDPVALDLIMGPTDPLRGGHHRERVEASRLRAITNHAGAGQDHLHGHRAVEGQVAGPANDPQGAPTAGRREWGAGVVNGARVRGRRFTPGRSGGGRPLRRRAKRRGPSEVGASDGRLSAVPPGSSCLCAATSPSV
jgi:hypothetical protein